MRKEKLTYLPITIVTAVMLTAVSGLMAGRAEATRVVKTATATVTVTSSCGMVADSTSHSLTAVPGTTQTLTGAKMTITCNQPNGYGIYARGAGAASDKTQLKASIGDSYNVSTGTSGSDSHWAFKVTAGSTTAEPSVVSTYSNYAAVPATYQKVASYSGSTKSVTGTLTASYQVFMKSSQAGGTYTGAVAYALTTTGSAPAN